MKDNTYVVIQSFMVDQLGLKGNELIVYAVIYGFTQDGDHWYYGTRGHLAEWCGATKGTVTNCLKSLVNKGLLRRREVERHCRVEIEYQAIVNFDTPLQKIDIPPYQKLVAPLPKISSINNIENSSNVDKHNNNKGRFIPPTAHDVKQYALENDLDIDAQHFIDYWESIGWVRGRTKMKNWKAAARQWARNSKRWKKEVDGTIAGYTEKLEF